MANRYYRDGHIVDRGDRGQWSDVSPGHARARGLDQVPRSFGPRSQELGFFGLAALAAAALIPRGGGTVSVRRPRPSPPRGGRKPPIPPKPAPNTSAELRAELERTRRAMRAAEAQVVAEHAKTVVAMRFAEAAEAARQAAATKAEAQLAKNTGDRKAYELAMGKLKAQVAEAQEARDRALAAGDQAAAAELEAARAEAKKAGERAAAELSARKQAEAAMAALEKRERAADAADAKAHAAELADAAAALAALRDQASTQQEAAAIEAARLRALAELAEAERQAAAKAEAELAATRAALAKLKEANATPPAPAADMQPRQAAIAMRYYLEANPTPAGFGYRNHPNDQVQTYQRYLGTGADGMVGPKTRAVASAQGVTLPLRPSADAVPPPAPPAPPPPAPRPPEVPPPTEPEAALRGRELRDYLVANPTRAAFGYRNSPSAPVVRFQRAAGIADDGILGPGVRAAGSTYGITFPARPS